jgi:basic amino acid/polyamine antiporter, APA family
MNSSQSVQPKRTLGLGSSLAIVSGSMLGIGIFLAPTTMSLHIHSHFLFFAVWIFTGIVALSGATAYAELGTLMPQSGGDYIFHREALGSSIAFAYGWSLLAAGFAGSIAAMSVPLCAFQLSTLSGVSLNGVALQIPLLGGVAWSQVTAMLLIVIMTLINIYGVKLSALLQSITTYVPILLLTGLSLYILNAPDLIPSHQLTAANGIEDYSWTYSGITTAFLEAYFAYSGWNAVIYAAGEVKKPHQTLPRALIGGTCIVMVLYLLFCTAALDLLDFSGLQALAAKHQDIGSAMAAHIANPYALTAIIAMIAIALIASINATILGGARVALALAKDGCFWKPAQNLHPRWGTPVHALWAQAFMSIVIVVLIPWYLIFSLVSLVMVVGGSLTVYSLYVLRKKMPRVDRPYKAMGYPYFPALFILSSLLVLIVKIYDAFAGVRDAWYPIWTLAMVFGIYVIHVFINRNHSNSSETR